MTDEFTLECTIEYNDLKKILEQHFENEKFIETVTCYLTEVVEYTIQLSRYLWDVLPYFVEVFDTKEECLKWINENYTNADLDNFIIYECSNGLTYCQAL